MGYAATTGLLESLTYPLSTESYRFKLRYTYQYGQLSQVSQFDTGTRYWLANANDAMGNVIDETLGDPADMPSLLETISGYDQITGLMDYRKTGPGGGTSAQDLTYEWNKVGSLTMRKQGASLTERFYYDNVHRLDYSTLNATTNMDLSYDARGNMLSKTGVGTYTYSPTKLHALASINTGSGTLNYGYDSNGNMTNRAGTTLSWFANNLPKSITVNSSNSSNFQYTPYGQRWKHDYRSNGTTENAVYIGSLMEKVTIGTLVVYKHYIHANGKTVAFYTRDSSGAKIRYTMLQDHLGSTDAFYNTNGILQVKESFDAFGKRRGTSWTGSPTPADSAIIASLSRRGLTNHEHLDSTGFIHMNGRIYDPSIARFASADPFIPDPTNAQDFNRYSYVDNNPLTFTDPSGFGPPELLKTDDSTDPVGNGGSANDGLRSPAQQFAEHVMNPRPSLGVPGVQSLNTAILSGAAKVTRPSGSQGSGGRSGRPGGGSGPGAGAPAPQEPIYPGLPRGVLPGEEPGLEQSFYGFDTLIGVTATAALEGLGCSTSDCQMGASLAMSVVGARVSGAARGGARLVDDAARVAGGGAPNRIYSARELVRRAAEPGPYHNFPESFNARIFSGNRQVISENYVLYSQRGTINGVNGTFEIGVRPSVSGGTETIMHRFFRPD